MYKCFAYELRLSFSVPKIKAIEAAIANFLPRLGVPDHRQWQALRVAIGHMHDINIDQGILSESVSLGIEALQDVESEMNVDEEMQLDVVERYCQARKVVGQRWCRRFVEALGIPSPKQIQFLPVQYSH